MVDNDEWLSKFGYVQFLRDYGVHFTINRMLAFDSVKARLDREQPMTFLEFNYMLMQSVDFLELERRFGCVLQMGGSDQWGNIVNGVELIRRVDQKPSFGLTTPLLSTASGQKMGKTVGGAVWLNADMRSPYDYWQFWRNTEDADVGRFMKLFTDMPLDEVARYEAMQGADINEAKKVLANETTRTAARTGGGRRRGRGGAGGLRGRQRLGRHAHPRGSGGRAGPPGSCWPPWRLTRAWRRRAARPGAWPRAAACGSMTRPGPTPTAP